MCIRDSGYLARVQAGSDALERSAAAQGRLRTGGTLTDLVGYNQDFAANEYKGAFDRAMNTYGANYKAAYDAFTPTLQAWQMRASGERDAQLARYNTELQKYYRDSAPAPSGGGGFDPIEFLGPEPQFPSGGYYGGSPQGAQGPTRYYGQDEYERVY